MRSGVFFRQDRAAQVEGGKGKIFPVFSVRLHFAFSRRLKIVFACAGVLLFLLGVMSASAPVLASTEIICNTVTASFPNGEPTPPTISAKTAVLIDADSGHILFSHAADARLPMASTTKIMTAVVALESLDLSRTVTVSRQAASTSGSVFGLQSGEQMTVEQLLYALLVLSGNDASVALAEAAAGSVPAFVAKMNVKAQELGLTNTHFANPNGLQAEGHYSSAKDLATLAAYALQNPVFRRIVDTTSYVALRPDGNGKQVPRTIKNHNLLLQAYPWVTGVKTGSTPYAKYCLVFSGKQDGLCLVGVLLGAKDDDTRWAESKAILDYGFAVCPRTILLEQGQTVVSLAVSDAPASEVELISSNALVARLYKDDKAFPTVTLYREPTLPIEAEEILGEVTFSAGNKSLGTAKLLATKSLPRTALRLILSHYYQQWPTQLPLAQRLAATQAAPATPGQQPPLHRLTLNPATSQLGKQ